MVEWILAFDFGGTKLSAALVAADSVKAAFMSTSPFTAVPPPWQAIRRVFSPPGADGTSDLATMIALGRELLAQATPAGEHLAAIGVSFGGPADATQGLVRLSHHVPGWEATPLQALLEAEFGVPVRLDNDANTAALGEYHLGAGQGHEHLFYVTVSTGVGGGWLLHGRIWRGVEGMAGEIGHTVADPHGPLCLCGKQGCVERLASGLNLAADYQAAHPHVGRITGQDVAQRAAQGDPLAQSLLQRSAWAIGVGLGQAANLINPHLFILGGGITKAGPDWWATVRQTARTIALPQITVNIVPAALGDDAPLWGAVMLVLTTITL